MSARRVSSFLVDTFCRFALLKKNFSIVMSIVPKNVGQLMCRARNSGNFMGGHIFGTSTVSDFSCVRDQFHIIASHRAFLVR